MIKFKSLPDEDKPRERLYSVGSENLSDDELIAIIIKTGTKDENVRDVSLKILESIGNISGLADIGINTLIKINGIGKVKAITLKAALELGKRVYGYKNKVRSLKLNNSEIIYERFSDLFLNKKQEYFYCIYLDNKGNYIDKKCLFIGTLNSSLIHPREIFKEAYLLSANGIICMHNHPSGDVTPSKEDMMTTKKIQEISILHGITLVDHIIFGNDNYYSFYENKKL